MKNWCREEGIVVSYNRPYTPRDAGSVEAFKSTLKRLLNALVIDHADVDLSTLLRMANDVYNNNRCHTSTNFKPSRLHHFGTNKDFEIASANQAAAWTTAPVNL